MARTTQTRTGRRWFLKRSAAGAGAGLLAACGDGAGTARPADEASMSDQRTDSPDGALDREISVRTIAEAEKLAGLAYTPAEREQMLGGFEDQLATIARLRSLDLPNGFAPACGFDPRLPGVAIPPQENRVRLAPRTAPLPDDPEAIAFAPVAHLAQWLRDGVLTSVALTQIYLERIDRFGARLECFVTITPELARAQAVHADRELAAGRDRGPLHGIPYVLKDLMDTADIATTWGAMPYKNRIPGTDSAVTRRLAEAGAVLLAKATCGAIAYGDIWFGGHTRNPWNTEEGSSGSSAGSAAATAAGLCGFSIGTETLGSIVSPSNRCGATGLRPTFGRVSRAGTMALCWSLDKIGPICRYTEDTALVLAALNGYDPHDAGSIDMGFAYDGGRSLDGLLVGYDPAWFEGAGAVAQHALDMTREIGVTLKEIRLPDLPYSVMLPAVMVESAAAFEELTLSNRDDEMVWQDDAAWPNGWRRTRLFPAVDYLQAERLRRQVMQVMDEAFAEVDAMIGPNYAGDMLTITNFTGHPCLALKAGFTESPTRSLFGAVDEAAGGDSFRVPETISLWAPLFQDGTAIRLGAALEARLGVADQHPDLS